MNNESRGPWYLLTGLVMGLALGLVYAWLINPVHYIDTDPSTLRSEFKDQYRSLIALAFRADQDVGRARSRLELLHDARPVYELGAQAQRVMAQNGSQQEARALAELAAALNQSSGAPAIQATVGLTPILPTPQESNQASDLTPTATLDISQAIQTPTSLPTSSPTPRPTFTARPSLTPMPTFGAPFALKDRQPSCDPQLPPGLLQIEILDSSSQPVAGVRVDITWDSGADFFFSGLYPEINPGYADYIMSPRVIYNVRVGEGGEVVSGISAQECKAENGSTFLGGIKLTFTQP